jgi:hypothetical protein
VKERASTPKNQIGQPPTRTPDETEERLEEKAQAQKGEANKIRTEEQIDEVRSKP